MLEFQIREKEKRRDEQSSKREKIYQHTYIMKDRNQLEREMDLRREAEVAKQQIVN